MDCKILLTLIGFVFVLGACERNSGGTTKLSIQFPQATSSNASSSKVSSQTVSASSTDDWSSVTPTGLTGATPINCYGVYISGPEDTLRQNQCGRSGASTPMKVFGVWKGAVPSGGSVELEVDSGKDRVVGVFGFYVSDMSACKDITGNTNMDKSKFSKPYFIGESAPQNFTGGSVTVPVTLAFNSDQWFEDCKGPGFPNGTGSGGGNTSSVDVGTGADGDFVVTGMMTDVRQVYGSLRTTQQIPLITTSRIMASNTVGGDSKKLSLTTKYTSLETKFLAGDEVYLYIAASSGTAGCGADLFTGFRTRGIVFSATGDNMVVTTDDARFSTVTNTSLAAQASGPSRDFCRMTVTRVPHLNKLTFNGGFLTWNAASYGDLNYESDNEAGLIIIRVKDKIETLSKGGIDVTGRGFSGGTTSNKDGQGTLGTSGTTPSGAAIGSAGGGSMSTPYSPGGGGHGGMGGDAVSVGKGGMAVGDQYGCGPSSYDASMKCLFGKIFMGGSGGAGYDSSGGAGGGIIVVYANSIVVGANQEMIFSADGNTSVGSSMGGGGGAGGTVLVNVNAISVAAGGTLRMTSNGGLSTISSDFGLGGAGGGGRNHLNILGTCSIANTGVSMESFAPKNYVVGKGGPGGDGTNYVSGGSSLSGCASSISMNQSPFMVKASPSSIAADTTNGVPITIYGESLNGIQSAVLLNYMGVAIDTCVLSAQTSSSFVCTTKAPAAQYSIKITDNLGRTRTMPSAINLL